MQHIDSKVNPFISQTSHATKEESRNGQEMAYERYEHERNAKNVHSCLQSHSPTKATKGQRHAEFPVHTEL